MALFTRTKMSCKLFGGLNLHGNASMRTRYFCLAAILLQSCVAYAEEPIKIVTQWTATSKSMHTLTAEGYVLKTVEKERLDDNFYRIFFLQKDDSLAKCADTTDIPAYKRSAYANPGCTLLVEPR